MDKKAIEQKLYSLLEKHKLHVAVAESCTGGLVSAYLCDISGISEFFEEGYVTYSEHAKIKNLAVSPDTIQTFGVVSEETASEMAKGAAMRSSAECAISTTGVAGPTGGTEKTPVGTVCFGCFVKGTLVTDRKIFTGNREEVRTQAALYALSFLTKTISEVTSCEL